jgi:hypothetical protein
MNLNDQIAKEIIRERSTRRYATKRPTHPRTARALRRLAARFDEDPR